MFKAQVLRRSFSLWRRVPDSHLIRTATQDGHETIQIQRVRFRKPLLNRSRLIGMTVTTGGAYWFLRWLDDDDEAEWETAAPATRSLRKSSPVPQSKNTGNNKTVDENGEEGLEDEENDEEEALLFLPSGFSRPKQREWYKGSDPEWQEFGRIAKDRTRAARIQGVFIDTIRREAMKHPGIKRAIGNIDPTKGSTWVEFKFPDGPPLEYERPGFELTDDLEWRRSSRTVQRMHHEKLANALVPTVAASAVYGHLKRKINSQWLGFKRYMGWNSNTTERTPVRFTHGTDSTTSPPVYPSAPGAAIAPLPKLPSNDKDDPSNPGTPAPGPISSVPGSQIIGRFTPDKVSVLGMKVDAFLFRQDYHKAHKKYAVEPPRGTFVVQGLVGLVGEHGRVTLDARGFYDPNAGKFVILHYTPKTLQLFKQTPKGGP